MVPLRSELIVHVGLRNKSSGTDGWRWKFSLAARREALETIQKQKACSLECPLALECFAAALHDAEHVDKRRSRTVVKATAIAFTADDLIDMQLRSLPAFAEELALQSQFGRS